MKKQYRLFYRDIELGEVVEEDADFPNVFGIFRPTANDDQKAIRDYLQKYITYSVAADQLMQEGKEEEWDRFAAENEPQFLDLIVTDDWQLRNEEGIEPILIPLFRQNNAVVWRWNLDPSKEEKPAP